MTENIQQVWNPLGPQASKTNIGTSLPASAIDGEEFLLVDDLTAPTNTQKFRWLDSIPGTNKWFAIAVAGTAVPKPPAGIGHIWFSDTPPAGYAILDGSTLAGAQTAYPKLWANVNASWKSGSDIILPDLRGRVPVGKGTHADVSTIGNSDGLAVGSRRPKHKHTAAVGTLVTGNDTPDHSHPLSTPWSADVDGGVWLGQGSGAQRAEGTGGASTRHTHPITGAPTVGPQTGAEPTDSAAFVVVNWIIQLS